MRLSPPRKAATQRRTSRRGVSIAAAALSLTLIAPAIAPVHSPFSPAVASAQQASANSQAIESTVTWLSQQSVNGYVFFDRQTGRSAFDGVDTAMPGVKVYAQWIDYRSKGGAVSPIYYTTSGADGKYSIGLPNWTDALGTIHVWEATVGQKLRVWVENPDTSKWYTAFSEGDSVFGGQGDRYRGAWNGAAGSQLVENWNFSFHERPQEWLWGDEITESPAVVSGGNINGQVYFDERGTYGDVSAVAHYNQNMGDVLVPGVKVRASYVQDEVARRFDTWRNANPNASLDEFRTAQQDIIRGYEAETGKSAIAETVEATTDENGRYDIQFRGLWGVNHQRNGIVTAGTWGELADSPEQGSFARGNVNSKHVNMDYMYIAPILPEGVEASMRNMREPLFQSAVDFAAQATTGAMSNVENHSFALRMGNRGFNVTPYDAQDNPAAAGETASTVTTGLIPQREYKIVWTDKDGNTVHECTAATNNVGQLDNCPFTVPEDLSETQIYTASVYSTSDTNTVLMADSFVALPDLNREEIPGQHATEITPTWNNSTIEAGGTISVPNTGDAFPAPGAGQNPTILTPTVDEDGWSVQAGADGNIQVTAPADAQPGDVATVSVLVTYPDGSTDIEKFTVTVTGGTTQADTTTPNWDNQETTPGNPVDVPNNGDDLPEGATVDATTDATDWTVETDEDGKVTVTPPATAQPGDKATVTVTVNYEDGSTDTETFTVTVQDPDATPTNAVDFLPQTPAVTLINPANPTTTSPAITFTGEQPDAPEFKLQDGWEAPEGYTVEVDAQTGVVTVTPPSSLDADTTETFTVPVVVTYPNNEGADSDTVNVIFDLDTDGDGIPDRVDDDDDGDGVSDQDEIDAGTNPKDPSDRPNNGGDDDADTADFLPQTPETTLIDPANPSTSSPAITFEGEQPNAPEFKLQDGWTAPDGYNVVVNPTTGVVTVTPPNTLDQDTAETFTVPVVVSYPNNEGAESDVVNVPFDLDTDGDGIPDRFDDDDDGDGVSDQDEIDAGTNPKDPSEKPEDADETDATDFVPVDPDAVLVTPGTDATSDAITFTGEQPEGATFEIQDGWTAPEGYTVVVNPSTGVVTVTAPEDLDKDTTEEFTVPVVVSYPNDEGSDSDTVNVTVRLDTDGDGIPDTIDDDDDGDGVSDQDEIDAGTNPKDKDSTPGNTDDATDFAPVDPEPVLVTPGEPVTTSPITFEGDDQPEDPKFELEDGWTPPEGYTVVVDPETGVVTVTAPTNPDQNTTEEFTVPVVVTYPNNPGSEADTVNVTVRLDTDGDGIPDTIDDDDDGDGVSDQDEIEAGTNPKDPNDTPSNNGGNNGSSGGSIWPWIIGGGALAALLGGGSSGSSQSGGTGSSNTGSNTAQPSASNATQSADNQAQTEKGVRGVLANTGVTGVVALVLAALVATVMGVLLVLRGRRES